MTVFNHPPPCASILTLSYGSHPTCAARVRNLNAAPGACSPHGMSRPVGTSACGLAMEPSNGFTQLQPKSPTITTTTTTTHRSLLRRLLTQMTSLGAWSTSLRRRVRCGWQVGAARVEERERRRPPHPYRFEPQPPTLPLTHVKNHAHTSPFFASQAPRSRIHSLHGMVQDRTRRGVESRHTSRARRPSAIEVFG